MRLETNGGHPAQHLTIRPSISRQTDIASGSGTHDCTAGNKADCMAVSIGTAAGLPTDRQRRSFRSRILAAGPTGSSSVRTNSSEVRSENLVIHGRGTSDAGCREPFAGDGARAKTLWRKHLAWYLSARRPRLSGRCRDNRALRVPVRIRPSCKMAGPLGSRPVVTLVQAISTGTAGR